MAGRNRGLLAALVLLLVLAGGALFASYRYQQAAARQNQLSLTVASADDMRSDVGHASDVQAQLIQTAVSQLETSYYKPVDPRTPMTGEVAALTAVLKAHKIAHPHFDGSTPEAVLASAESRYGARLGPDAQTNLTQWALRGIMDSVDDPYTVYLAPKEIQGLQESLQGGNFGGIGVYIGQTRAGLVQVAPIPGLPADQAGMKPGEIVDTVDGKGLNGLTLDVVENMIRGSAGTTVHLSTHLPDEPKSEHHFAIVRQIIHVPTVQSKMLSGKQYYIRLTDFGSTSADEMKKALLAGKAAGAKGFIFDLRDNGGGFVEQAVKISSLFIPHGAIVATIDRAGDRDEEDAIGDAIGGLGPVVILVNAYTASASEITSGALQDYHLATLVGTKTFGKGVVQSIYQMMDSGALKITTARYVTPLGRDIQHKGIVPDIVVNQSLDPRLIGTKADKQLAAAQAQLRKEIR